MKYFLTAIVLFFGLAAFSAETPDTAAAPKMPSAVEVKFHGTAAKTDLTDLSAKAFKEGEKYWTTPGRKLASDMQGQLKPTTDMQTFVKKWLAITTPEQFVDLLKEYEGLYKDHKLSPDMQYFYLQIALIKPFQGIVWKLRKIFEHSNTFLGNSASHVAAVQLVRGMSAAMKLYLPTENWKAGFRFITEPTAEMTSKDQFDSIAAFQNFISTTVLQQLEDSRKAIVELMKANPKSTFVFDYALLYGAGPYAGGVNEYIGHGRAEQLLALAGIATAQQELYMFSALNMDAFLSIMGKFGNQVGMDSSRISQEDMGLTAEERDGIVVDEMRHHRFLEIRDYGNTIGSKMMGWALISLRNSVNYTELAYHVLQNQPASPSMGLNPVHYQDQSAHLLKPAIDHAIAMANGPTEITDPVIGQTITVDMPSFYTKYPGTAGNKKAHVYDLVATSFEGGTRETTITGKDGKPLTYRNYFKGRSETWNNDAWATYVPSAAGKPGDYMRVARHIMKFNLGTTMVFGPIDFFVR